MRKLDDPRWKRVGDASEMGVMSGVKWATYLAGIGIQSRQVPSEFWFLDGETAVVACPCGHEPAVPAHEAPSPCGCGRYFFFSGEDLYALGKPDDSSSPVAG